MKNLILLCSFLLLNSSFTNETCDFGCLQNKAQAALNDFTFIRQFPVEITSREKKLEISYVLSVYVNYRIAIADNEAQGKRVVVKLLDRNRKVISTNITAGTRQFSPNIDFACPATGVYYIEACIEKNNSGNGLIILGYKKATNPSSTAGLQ